MPGRQRTSIVHHNNENTEEFDKVAEVMRFATGFIGPACGIYGAVRLTPKDLTSYPYVSIRLAQHIPLGVSKGLIVPFTDAGIITNHCMHFAITVDLLIEIIRSFPRSNISYAELKNWISKRDITNFSDIIVVFFGLGLSGALIYYNATSSDHFYLPFHAEKGVPNVLMPLMIPILLPGGCANLITYTVEGIMQALRGIMHGISWIEPAIKDNLPDIFFHHNLPNPKGNTCAKIFIVAGLFVGLGFGINAAVRLNEKNLSSFPYLSNDLAAHLPLEFYQAMIPLLGTFPNYYSHFGLVMGIMIQGLKGFPWKGSGEDVKNWFLNTDLKNAARVFGALLGSGLFASFSYFNTTSDDPFALPFGGEKGVPDVLLQMLALIYIVGAFTNFFGYFTESVTQVATGPRVSIRNIGSKVKNLLSFSIFNRNRNTSSSSAPAPMPSAPAPV